MRYFSYDDARAHGDDALRLPDYTDPPIPGLAGYAGVCTWCGALVTAPAKHDEFHLRSGEVANYRFAGEATLAAQDDRQRLIDRAQRARQTVAERTDRPRA